MVEEGEEKIGDLPDELRCRRSDGRQWRCKRRVVGEGKMCAYHLCRSNGKGVRVGRVVERKERGRVDDGVKLSVEGNRVVELGGGVKEEGRSLDGKGCRVPLSGRKRKGVKRYGDDGEEEDLSGGSKKEEWNVDESLKLGGKEVTLVAEGCSVSGSGRKKKPVKRYGDDDEEDLSRGSKKKEGNVDMLSMIKNVKKGVREVTVRRVALDEEMVPNHLRCIRTDGKRWRCSRRVKDGATMCENHYIQGRLRQAKAVVPESLKLQRRDRVSLFKCSQNQVSKFGGGKKRRPVKWRQWSKFSETLDGALRKLQLKKSDTELQLLKAYLKRQAEKLEMQQQFAGAQGYCQKEVTKNLPFGAMTISASPALQAACVAGTSVNFKIGSDPDTLSGVSFRSKNIEPVPIGSSKVMPGVKEMVKLKRAKKRCHFCHKLGSHLAKCSACKKESFCMECIEERYHTSRDDVEKSCPVCCKQCGCEACLLTQSKDAQHENSQNVERRLEKVAHAQKLIYSLLPVLKRIKDELRLELELEANNKGKLQSEVSNRQVENSCNEQIYCSENGKGCNVNTLCLNCSGDLTERLTNEADVLLSNYFNQTLNTRSLSRELVAPLSSSFWKFGVNDGIICCPPINFDGCEHCLLVLRRVFISKWINVLQENAEKEVYSFFDSDETDVSSCRDEGHETDPIEQVQRASLRNGSDDNFLYYPSIADGQLLENFHKHWRNNHPIVVRNVLQQKPDLCWDPIFFFRSYLERCSADSADAAEVEASNCLNWCQVEIGIRQSYVGHSKEWSHANMWDETLKLKGCLSSHLFQNKFPDHYDGIVRSLPHQDYMNPMVGRSNLAVNIPPEVKPDLGPYIHISYGIRSDSVDSMGLLCYNSYDTVNIMVHATEVAVPSEQVTQVRKLMERKWSEYQQASAKMTSGITTSKKKGKLSNKDGILKGLDLPNKKGATTCEGESGESCNSVVVHEPSGRSAAVIDGSRESRSDSGASNLCSEKQDNENVMRNFRNVEDADDDSASVSCSAEWDVFRRKDILTLLDYLKLHSDKLMQPSGVSQNGAQPVLGRSVFLEQKDKSRLKEEFGIEPWTFKQRVGEAVVIPAGCPYQIRALKSCVSVAFDFVSPECASAPADLSKDLKLLSDDRVSEDKLEVKKMVLYNVSAALQQLSELNPVG